MASLRDIRSKIRAVKNIQQITQAMKMVAAARLRRVQERVTAGKPYSDKMQHLVSTLSRAAGQIEHPLMEKRSGGPMALVVIASDKGLCGSYNNNVLRRATNYVAAQKDRSVTLITVGRKATDYFRRRSYDLHASFAQVAVDAPYSEVKAIADCITGAFLKGTVNEVQIAYTEFINTISQRPQLVKFLPIEPPAEAVEGGARPAELEYIFEPPARELLTTLLPRYVDGQVYHVLLESMASEFGARMTAMSNATENAGELIENLTLTYNKARQSTITRELLEVVSGAEALRSG